METENKKTVASDYLVNMFGVDFILVNEPIIGYFFAKVEDVTKTTITAKRPTANYERQLNFSIAKGTENTYQSFKSKLVKYPLESVYFDKCKKALMLEILIIIFTKELSACKNIKAKSISDGDLSPLLAFFVEKLKESASDEVLTKFFKNWNQNGV
ncbi:MAG: hypothetical protein IPM57_10750 [Oligoflexia bacterium]|nr:hypothetical protein [Oligoflexia bacterium]